MAAMDVDKDLIRELSELLEETGLTEIEISDNGRTVRVARNAGVVAPSPAPGAETPQGESGGNGTGTGDADASHPGAVASPMVGTAYSAPEPNAPPFVKQGDMVSEGQTLLIVEAMKTLNPIPSPRGGTVARIFVTDGQPVEYGELLMIIE